MKEKILIVEDEFIVANDLRIMLKRAGHEVCGIAASVEQAKGLIEIKRPDWVLLDIVLKGTQTGIDLAADLFKMQIPFLFISANTNQSTLEAAKATQPYGFLVKPFRERDLMVMLDIARHRYGVEMGRQQQKNAAQAVAAVDGIVGSSAQLKEVIRNIRLIAPVDTAVLILGESGTGKEKVAHAIHDLSERSKKPMITINCAALPPSLIESELFGHERGAFTGATGRRTGKFEQANGGTIFLDEIGELPLEAQSRLLRVLQEKEIERIGGDQPFKIDVRIIAATNRNLEKEVAEKRFRLDLYYRLNVFRLQLPPLRDRIEDITLLADYFLSLYAKKMGRPVNTISAAGLAQLKQYAWPGNIRELEHLIERSLLLAGDKPVAWFDLASCTVAAIATGENGRVKTLEEMERDHILYVLKICNGKVSGPGGAAEMLNLPAQTLYSKMRKLDIKQVYK
ncbi:sigma-54-dependent transcriptional regulator [Deminuibacter soli]|uniref:Sigma-54-dependent Fis family transcriptional regulator n=1 Tax=Deminuibacter soli TaxID=2291815 RepID=A0A3E1NRP0_9BACT|nr:sigma-54 dependent transcriptional regulator [Deminuibacter soli]RFM30596.1 sigma-54-dependent Fis family transcriptional regulator [Deminuibacter soli]